MILVAIDEQFQNIDKWIDNFGNGFVLMFQHMYSCSDRYSRIGVTGDLQGRNVLKNYVVAITAS